jgi:hypothetical protein
MSVVRYKFFPSRFKSEIVERPDGEFVKYEDYKYLSDYCDHLVSFSKLPCLPKDLENLREANAFFATENQQLKDEIERLKQAI